MAANIYYIKRVRRCRERARAIARTRENTQEALVLERAKIKTGGK